MDNTLQIRVRSIVWLATGVALSLVAVLAAVSAWPAEAGRPTPTPAPRGGGEATYVPTEGCRAFDFRPGEDQVGSRGTPLGPGETYRQPITGGEGNCVGALEIPSNAVGVAMNVTAVQPTAQSNLRFWPNGELPTLSNLNFSAGQAPFPNKVDVALGLDGALNIYNQNGSVFVVGDVVGYYIDFERPFTLSGYDPRQVDLTDTPTAVVDLTGPPIGFTGWVTVNWSTYVHHEVLGADIGCKPELAEVDVGGVERSDEGVGWWETGDSDTRSEEGSIAGTRRFRIDEGVFPGIEVVCEQSNGNGGYVRGATITAMFFPDAPLREID